MPAHLEPQGTGQRSIKGLEFNVQVFRLSQGCLGSRSSSLGYIKKFQFRR